MVNQKSSITSYLTDRFIIAKEGIFVVLVMMLITGFLWCVMLASGSKILLWAAILLTIISGVVIFFFRSPRRSIPILDDGDILSPADGKIISINPAYELEFLKRKATRVSIFLSLLDVHVNRIPVNGVVRYKNHSDGRSLPAYFENASNENQRVAVGIEADDGFCMTVVQIVGFFARRITCRLDLGQHVKSGDCYGMIYLGSRVDVFMPDGVSTSVRVGDRVYAGTTVIGKKDSGIIKSEIPPS